MVTTPCASDSAAIGSSKRIAQSPRASADFLAFARAESDRLGKVIKDNKIKVE